MKDYKGNSSLFTTEKKSNPFKLLWWLLGAAIIAAGVVYWRGGGPDTVNQEASDGAPSGNDRSHRSIPLTLPPHPSSPGTDAAAPPQQSMSDTDSP